MPESGGSRGARKPAAKAVLLDSLPAVSPPRAIEQRKLRGRRGVDFSALPIKKMPLAKYPRPGQALSPKLLADVLDAPARSTRPHSYRLNELDAACWRTLTADQCRAAAAEIVSHLTGSLQSKRLRERRVPKPSGPVVLEELFLGTRTFNCLAALRRGCPLHAVEDWHALTIEKLMGLPGFGAKSLVDFLVSYESSGFIEQDEIRRRLVAMDSEMLLRWAKEPTQSVPRDLLGACIPVPADRRRLSDLDLDHRTLTRLQAIGLGKHLSSLSRLRVGDLVGLPGFGPLSLARLLKAMHEPPIVGSAAVWPGKRVPLPAARDIEEELQNAISAALRRPGTASSIRNASLVLLYSGWDGEAGRTLQQVGDRFRMTRERVRQICAKTTARMASLGLETPLVQAALQVAEGLCPHRASEIERRLQTAGISRSPFRLEGLLTAAAALGHRADFELVAIKGQRVAIRAGQVLRMQEIVRHSEAVVQRRGIANLREVAALASQQMGEVVSRRWAAAALECFASLQWLDGDKKWFTLGHIQNNRAVARIRKILSVSPRIHISELRNGLARHRSKNLYVVPSRVVLRLCESLDGCVVEDRTIALSNPGKWAFAVRGTERKIIAILRKHGGVMHKSRLEAAALKIGLLNSTVQFHLSTSPVLVRLDVGIYAIRGWVIDPKRIERIQHKYRQREPARLNAGRTSNGSVWLSRKASLATLNSGFFSVPIALTRFLDGKFELTDAAGRSCGVVTVRGRNARGFGPFLRSRQIAVGDSLRVEFNPRSRTVVVWGDGDRPSLQETRE